MRKVEQQNLLALVLHESYATIHCGPPMVFPVLLCVPCGKDFFLPPRGAEGTTGRPTLKATPRRCPPSPAPSPAPPHPSHPLRPGPDARRLCRLLFRPPR